MKNKKLMSCLLSLFIFISCINNVFAVNTITDSKKNNIELVNKHVSSEIADLLIGITQGQIDLTNVEVQSAIKVGGNIDGEYYLCPILVNDSVEYVCRVHYDGTEFVSTLSEQLSENFELLFNQKQKSNYSLAVINDNLVLIEGKDFEVWAKDLYEKPINEKHVETYILSSSINYFENKVTCLDNKINIVNNVNKNTRATYYLPIDYLNKQQYNGYPWCAGYVAANILRYMTGDRTIYASDIASFGDIATNQSIPRSVIKQYANYMHHIIVTEFNGIANLTNTVLNYQLSHNQPIYGSFIDNSDSSSAHAVVVHGFNGTTVNFRNPWNTYSETYKCNAYAFVDAYGTKWIQRGYMTFE